MAASGMEMMLKAAGLGDVIKFAQEMQANQVPQKILAFADGVDKMNGLLERIERKLDNGGSSQAGSRCAHCGRALDAVAGLLEPPRAD